MADRTVPLDAAKEHVGTVLPTKGDWRGALRWAPRLVPTESLARVGGLFGTLPPREGPSGLASPSGRRMSGVWRLDLLLGDLGRYHSLVAEGGGSKGWDVRVALPGGTRLGTRTGGG